MTCFIWGARGSKWYYIKESGAMAKTESVLINGKPTTLILTEFFKLLESY